MNPHCVSLCILKYYVSLAVLLVSLHEQQDRRYTKFPNMMGFLGYMKLTQQKNQLVGNLGWNKKRFGQTLIGGLTTFAHKLSIPP